MTVTEKKIRLYKATVKNMRKRNEALREQIETMQAARMPEAGAGARGGSAYTVIDRDPVTAEFLAGEHERICAENKLLREEIKVKEVWISDLIERCKEFRAENEELKAYLKESLQSEQCKSDTIGECIKAFDVIADTVIEILKNYLEGN